jgi:hypothetical protein
MVGKAEAFLYSTVLKASGSKMASLEAWICGLSLGDTVPKSDWFI